MKQTFARAECLWSLVVLASMSGCQTREHGTDPSRSELTRAHSVVTGIKTYDDVLAELGDRLPAFGGFFFDETGRLVVQLTDPTRLREARALLKQHFATTTNSPTLLSMREKQVDAMTARSAQYGFRQLLTWYRSVLDAVYAVPGVTMSSVDEARNRVVIGVADRSLVPTVESVLRLRGAPTAAFIIEVFPALRPNTSLQGTVRPVIAGVQIQAGGGTCTLGFSVGRRLQDLSVEGTWYFVTNSHCTSAFGQVSGDVGGQPTAGSAIGTEVLDPQPFTSEQDASCPNDADCRYSDAAIFRYTTTEREHASIAWPAVGSTDFSSRIFIDDQSDPIQGMTVHLIGRTSGHRVGQVGDVCVTFPQRGTNRVFLCQAWVMVSSGEGDSGGPVVEVTMPGLTVGLRGIFWGSSADTSGFSMSSKWRSELEAAFGTGWLDATWWIHPTTGKPFTEISGPTMIPPGVMCRWTATTSGGTPPYSIQWSGVLEGGSSQISGIVAESGDLHVAATDSNGYTGSASIFITVEPGIPAPPECSE